jgi:hypothetical protein
MAVGTSNPRPSETEELDSNYTRLHITPLNPTLLPSILPPAVLTAARNISYHSLQTFPEKEFGFVELPSMEAQKIKKKLNGSILKGTKIKIEDARPSKQKPGDEETALPVSEARAERREIPSKKRKRDTETLPGIELRDRKVKRGWTDPVAVKKLDRKSKSKKDAVKSKYTSGPELLFRTTLPANIATSTEDISGLKSERKKKRKQTKEVVVHEFSKTTKHASFLRSSTIPSSAKGVAEYVEGKGWVDASGNIVEAPIAKPKKEASRKIQKPPSSSESSVSSKVDEESDTEDSTEDTRMTPTEVAGQVQAEASSTSSSGTSSDEEDEVNDDVSSSSESAEEESSKIDEDNDDSRPLPSPKTPISLKIDIPKIESPTKPESVPTVHPLEALFKRRRPNLETPKIPEAVPSFSFFDADGEDDQENDVVDSIPMTPFTKQDFALRGLRSAAPTPDTAFPGKTYTVWPTNNSSKEDSADVDGDATPTQKHKAKEVDPQKDLAGAPVSDFQKWFYEHRGENNRAWKRRRKLAAKEKRHRENKKRSERNV